MNLVEPLFKDPKLQFELLVRNRFRHSHRDKVYVALDAELEQDLWDKLCMDTEIMLSILVQEKLLGVLREL